jgi:hypothetical protein
LRPREVSGRFPIQFKEPYTIKEWLLIKIPPVPVDGKLFNILVAIIEPALIVAGVYHFLPRELRKRSMQIQFIGFDMPIGRRIM